MCNRPRRTFSAERIETLKQLSRAPDIYDRLARAVGQSLNTHLHHPNCFFLLVSNASTHTRTHTHTHARTHAHTHTHTHAHTHTHTHLSPQYLRERRHKERYSPAAVWRLEERIPEHGSREVQSRRQHSPLWRPGHQQVTTLTGPAMGGCIHCICEVLNNSCRIPHIPTQKLTRHSKVFLFPLVPTQYMCK